jgi:hypothetical protein
MNKAANLAQCGVLIRGPRQHIGQCLGGKDGAHSELVDGQ